MKLKKFLATNSIAIGTSILISGFITMFLLVFVKNITVTMVLIVFVYTYSGILFWALGSNLQPAGLYEDENEREHGNKDVLQIEFVGENGKNIDDNLLQIEFIEDEKQLEEYNEKELKNITLETQ